MKAISLWQPWATMYCAGIKVAETRGWDTKHRGPMLVHAAKKWTKQQQDFWLGLCLDHPELSEYKLEFGGLVGKVDLIDTTTTDNMKLYLAKHLSPTQYKVAIQLGDYSAGRFAWYCENEVLFKDFIPMKGQQGFWNVPDIDKSLFEAKPKTQLELL